MHFQTIDVSCGVITEGSQQHVSAVNLTHFCRTCPASSWLGIHTSKCTSGSKETTHLNLAVHTIHHGVVAGHVCTALADLNGVHYREVLCQLDGVACTTCATKGRRII